MGYYSTFAARMQEKVTPRQKKADEFRRLVSAIYFLPFHRPSTSAATTATPRMQ